MKSQFTDAIQAKARLAVKNLGLGSASTLKTDHSAKASKKALAL